MFDTSLSALVAAGGNSRAARSARARLQWRDRFGRWIEMGRGVKFKVRGADGAARSVIGSFVGAKDANTGQVFVAKDPNGLPDGFYDVTSANAQEFVANLSEAQLAERGIQLGRNADGQAVGERADEDIPNINELQVHPAPEGWVAQPGTYGGKKVIQTDDGDFRVHFGGNDENVLLEDHRANPGQAEPQRSMAEAFKKVSDVDLQREESGDSAYTGLAQNNDEVLANRDRDSKIEQIKANERTLLNEKAPLGAKQTAMTANETLKKELEAEGQPYDPEGNDSDEALAARKAAPAAETAQAPQVSTGAIDTSTFEVSPEGFLVPTGKRTNDITPEGLANFMTAEKEQLGKGGARLVVDTDNNTAEIYNSADTLDNAKAQAGGLGQSTVLDLQNGSEVSVSDKAVDPNSPDVNPNLEGDTSAEAPNAEDRNPDAVESQPANPGADDAARPEPRGEDGGPAAVSDSPDPEPARPAGDAPADNAGDSPRAADERPSEPAAAPGSVEDLKDRRAKVQAAMDVAGDPKDIIALNEQADALDARLARERGAAPEETTDSAPDNEDLDARINEVAERLRDAQKRESDALGRLNASTSEEEDQKAQEDIDRLFDEVADLEEQFQELEARQKERAESDAAPQTDAPEAEADAEPEVDPSAWAANKLAPTKEEIKNAPAGSLIAEEHDESGDKRIYRKNEAGKWEQLKRDGSGEPTGYVTRGDHFDTQGSRSHYATDEAGTRPESPEVARRREEQLARIEEPEAVPAPEAPERPEYQEPGNTDAAATARAELEAIDAEIENQISAAELATDPQVEAEHLSRVRTLERQRKIQENALNRALGNEPMDFNGDLGWNMRDRENRGSLPEAPEPVEAPETAPEAPEAVQDVPEADTPAILDDSLDAQIAQARMRLEQTEAERRQMLIESDDWDSEEYDELEARRDALEDELRTLERQSEAEAEMAALEAQSDVEAAPEPETFEETAQRVLVDAARVDETLSDIDPREGTGGVFDQKDDPRNVSSGHENRIEALKAKMQGKELTPDEQRVITEALNSGMLSDNQLSALDNALDGKSNRANTTTVARPETDQPEYLNTADVEVVNAERDDPDFVFDEDLTWRRVQEEYLNEDHPEARLLENGDLVVDSVTNKGKRYDAIVRRTQKNRFMAYVMETDETGNRRAKRISNSEWHSYEALENRITTARKLINGSSPAGSITRRKDQPTENLGTQGFPADDFLGDIGNPDAPLPETGDEKFDVLLSAVATHIRNGDADLAGIEDHLRQIDPGAKAIDTIMQAVIGRAQDTYRPNGTNPWQMYDGETAEIGMEFDWTDWHQELDWWLPNGQLNPKRRANPSYGQVQRGRVVGYVKENTDGKGHTYGDHVWVQLQNSDGTWSNWVKRSAQTLRRAEPGSALGLPFFSKREEWRTSPEALARRFRVPNVAADEPVVTKERPRRDLPQSRRLRFTPRGSLSGYSNVPVPKDQPTIAGMIQSGEITPRIGRASEARPGMMIVRMDDDGNQHVDSIIRVENMGDGGYRIHAARPDGRGYADVDSFVVPGDADIALWNAPAIRGPETPEPKNTRRGDLVEFDRNGVVENGVVAFDDDNGNLTVVTPGNETIDILESNIRPASYQDITREERTDVLESLDNTDMPQLIRNLIMRGILDPGLSRLRYEQILETLGSFGPKGPTITELDALLDMMGASDQDRADVRDYLDTP